MDGTAWLVIDPDGRTWTHEDIPCWSTSVCMCLYVYLLVFHDLISGLEHRCILHVDAFCHFHHFLQQLCAIPEKNKGACWCLSGDYKIMHNTVRFIDTWRCKCRLQTFAANYVFTFHNKNYFNYKNMHSTLIVFQFENIMGYIGANDQLMPHLFPTILDTGGRSEPSVCWWTTRRRTNEHFFLYNILVNKID